MTLRRLQMNVVTASLRHFITELPGSLHMAHVPYKADIRGQLSVDCTQALVHVE